MSTEYLSLREVGSSQRWLRSERTQCFINVFCSNMSTRLARGHAITRMRIPVSTSIGRARERFVLLVDHLASFTLVTNDASVTLANSAVNNDCIAFARVPTSAGPNPSFDE